MATTKIFPITATTGKAIAYIAKAEKTDNGRLISTYMCSRDPDKAAKEFAEMLEKLGIPATVRRELGRDIDAACGQLRKKTLV